MAEKINDGKGNTFHGTAPQTMLAKMGWQVTERRKQGCVWIIRWYDHVTDGIYNQETAVYMQRQRNKQKRNDKPRLKVG